MIIKVKDINDEPPYFINRPLPMQAVVKLNAPPNTPVFTLQAKDPDTDHNLHYFLVRDRSQYYILYQYIISLYLKIYILYFISYYYNLSLAAGGRFEVDEGSGVVRTRGTEPFQLDMEYVLYVKAEDQNGRDGRRYQVEQPLVRTFFPVQ